MKIYIIDDDPLSIFLAKTKLSMADPSHTIKTFASGPEALTALKAEAAPDMILLDLNMPIMDGWGFLDALTSMQNQVAGACKVYILSSSIAEAELEKGKENKFVAGFLHKPIQSQDIKGLFST